KSQALLRGVPEPTCIAQGHGLTVLHLQVDAGIVLTAKVRRLGYLTCGEPGELGSSRLPVFTSPFPPLSTAVSDELYPAVSSLCPHTIPRSTARVNLVLFNANSSAASFRVQVASADSSMPSMSSYELNP